jgi:hypothetical protein
MPSSSIWVEYPTASVHTARLAFVAVLTVFIGAFALLLPAYSQVPPAESATTFIGVNFSSLVKIDLSPLSAGGYDIKVAPIPNSSISPKPGYIASLAYASYKKLLT